MPDKLNFAPRAGFTWAPFKSGKTTLRGSWGMFYDWLSTGTYAQTLQIDGFRQREVNIINPSYPDPGSDGVTRATNRYLLAEDRAMAYSQRLSAGIAQTLSRRINANVLYSYGYRYSLLTGPQSQRARQRRQTRSRTSPTSSWHRRRPGDAALRQCVDEHQPRARWRPQGGPPGGGGGPVMIGGGGGPMMIMMGPGGPAASGGPRWSWRRGLSIAGFYNLGRQLRQHRRRVRRSRELLISPTSGAPPAFDRRHNGNVAITSSALRNFTARLGFNGSSAPPLTIRTGLDDNGDLVFNDRPTGVGRNSARTRGHMESNASFTYAFTLGKKQVTSGGGVQIMGWTRRPDRQSDRLADAAALPFEPLGEHPEPVESAGLFRLQRRHELAVLPAADARRWRPPRHVQRQRQLLTLES